MSPLSQRLLAVYAILAIAVFAFPGGLVGWLDDRNASGWLNAPLAAMRGVEKVSAKLGVEAVGMRLRKAFSQFVGEDEG